MKLEHYSALALAALLYSVPSCVAFMKPLTAPSKSRHAAPSSNSFSISRSGISSTTCDDRRRLAVQLGMVSSISNNERVVKDRRYTSSSLEKTHYSSTATTSSVTCSSLPSLDYAPPQAATSSSLGGRLNEFWMPVISAALLITGNTFGAGSLVLPHLVQGPGLAVSSGVFIGAYLMNLLSGLIIAEVAIQQKERSGTEVPSSFKEMVEGNLDFPILATLVSAVSFGVNALVFSFDMSRVGVVANQLTGVAPATVSTVWGAALVALLSTQSSQRISNIASVCVAVLFASFGSLLVPGLAHTDPMAAWAQPGLAAEPLGALGDLAPVILMAMIYQNMVPTVTRLHDYDRTKTVASIVLGSAVPLAMYIGWCVACLGGGIDLGQIGMSGGPLLAIFSLSTLAGSSIGCGLSCASELETFIGKQDPVVADSGVAAATAIDAESSMIQEENTGFQLPSALATVALPLSLTLAVTTFGNGDLTAALSVAGGLGSPLLYGVLPVWMAWNQRQQDNANEQGASNNLVPSSGLGFLGTLAAGMFGSEALNFVTEAAGAATL